MRAARSWRRGMQRHGMRQPRYSAGPLLGFGDVAASPLRQLSRKAIFLGVWPAPELID